MPAPTPTNRNKRRRRERGESSDRLSPLRVEDDGPLRVVTFDQPPSNVFGRKMIDALTATVEEAATGPCRALLFEADGWMVSSGADVNLFDGLSAEQGAALWRELLGLAQRVEDLSIPTVFAAHGLCLTAAFELALACDLLLAAESAEFGQVERVVGLTPGMGGTQRLVERAGPARAKEMVMTGEVFDAATLERWNIVNRVFDDDGFATASREFAQSLAQGPTRAHAATKAVVRACLEGGSRAADRIVPTTVGDLFETEDLRAAVQLYLTEGPGHAEFQGR